jgi:hypothetical protein
MRDFDRKSVSGECDRYYETPFYAIAYVLRSITFLPRNRFRVDIGPKCGILTEDVTSGSVKLLRNAV